MVSMQGPPRGLGGGAQQTCAEGQETAWPIDNVEVTFTVILISQHGPPIQQVSLDVFPDELELHPHFQWSGCL